MKATQWEVVLAVLTLAVCNGCGSSGLERASVSGTVKYNGELIEEGTIRFIPTGGGPSSGGKIKDGIIDIADDMGPVIGKQRVAISGQKFTGREIDKFPPHKIMWKERQISVPVKFDSDPTHEVEIQSGSNELELAFEGPEMPFDPAK